VPLRLASLKFSAEPAVRTPLFDTHLLIVPIKQVRESILQRNPLMLTLLEIYIHTHSRPRQQSINESHNMGYALSSTLASLDETAMQTAPRNCQAKERRVFRVT
jgi:hypothetical protein